MSDQGLVLIEEPVEVKVSTPKPRMALSVKKDFDPYQISLADLLAKEAFLDDRAVCETNLEQLQFIVYITLVDTTGNEVKYFGYTRGNGSGEQRLAGMVSFGIGGHVEEAPTDDKTLSFVLARSAMLEVNEEVGLVLPTRLFEEAFEQISAKYEDGNNKLYVCLNTKPVMYNETNAVSCVHLAISIIIHGDMISFKHFGFGAMEEGIITKGQWLTRQEIYENSIKKEEPIELEAWSTQFFNIIFPDGIAKIIE